MFTLRISLCVALGWITLAGCGNRDRMPPLLSSNPNTMTMFTGSRSRETVQLSDAPAGYSLVPVADATPPHYAGDVGPAQLFEVIRPDNGPVTLGRMYWSCTCIMAETPKKSYAAGERVLVTVRHVKEAPEGGATFVIGVKVASPVDTLLNAHVTVGR